MTQSRNRLSTARRYMEVYRESWKADHRSAMECRDFEELLGEGVRVFDLIHAIILGRRLFVYRGVMDPSPEMDQEEKRLMREYLELMKTDLPQLETMELSFGEIVNARPFRERIAQADMFLANWKPPVTAMAPGSRVVDFSEEDVSQLEALLKSPAGAPGRLLHSPRSLPEADPSILK
jgi:hypothetical protein